MPERKSVFLDIPFPVCREQSVQIVDLNLYFRSAVRLCHHYTVVAAFDDLFGGNDVRASCHGIGPGGERFVCGEVEAFGMINE